MESKTTQAPEHTPDYSRKWYVMTAVGAGVFLATVDGSIINVSLPTLVRALHCDFALVQWVVLSYLLTITCSMAAIGRFADMVGKKWIYMLGFGVFTVGSALCGLSPTVGWLISFRVLQAMGAAMTMALGAAIVTEAFPREERGRAMGIIGSIVSVGIIAGPALGGVILGILSWHWIFFVNLPVGIAGILLAHRFIPSFTPKGRQKFDIPGAVTLCLGLLVLLLGLTLGQRQGFANVSVWLLVATGLLLLIVFVFIERRVEQPMIDPKLFRNSLFRVNLTTGFVSFVALGGSVILLPFYLENILGLPSMQVGLLMGIIPVMLGITSPISGSLSDKISGRKIAIVGLAVMMLGFFAASGLEADTSLVGYGLRIFGIGAGIGIFLSPNNSAIMGAAPPNQTGVVSGMMALSRTLGQTVGVAVIGAIWAGRTLYYAGQENLSDASLAPFSAQIEGLDDAFSAAAVLILFALLFNVRAYFAECRRKGNESTSLPESD